MSNARKPKDPLLAGNVVARSTAPLMEANPNQGENMSESQPIEVVTELSSDTEKDTTLVARFNRKKVAKIAGTATAVVGALALFGAAMKRRGKEEFIDDVGRANGDVPDETLES